MTAGNAIKKGWRRVPLKRIAREVVKKEDSQPEGVPYVGLENIESWTGRLIGLDAQLEPTGAVSSFAKGDVLFGKLRPYLAKSVIAPFNGVGTGELIVLRPNRETDARFLNYMLLTPEFIDLVNASTYGAKMPRANSDFIGSIPVLVPERSTQRRVADFLDRETAKIDELITDKERMLKLLDERCQTLITEAVTRGLDPTVPMKPSGLPWLGDIPAHWSVQKLKHLAHGICSGKTPRGGSEVYVDEGIPMIRSLNVYDDGFRPENLVYITDEMDEDMQSSRLVPGDLLLNITGASIGRSCAFPADLGPANVNQHVCRIRPLNSNVGAYLEIVLKTPCVKAQILAGEDGTSREGLTHEDVRNLTLAFPPQRDERRRIIEHWVELIKHFKSIKASLIETVARLRERRAATIYESVTGQLDVRGFA